MQKKVLIIYHNIKLNNDNKKVEHKYEELLIYSYLFHLYLFIYLE